MTGDVHTPRRNRLAIVIACGTLMSTAGFVGQTHEREPGEIVQNVGDPQGSIQNLAVFFAHTKLAFLGAVDNVAPILLPEPDGRDAVFTRMTFKPTEFLKGSPPVGFVGTLDVWTLGGSYVETSTGRRPFRPARITQGLQPGAVYFVAVATIDGYPSLDGRYVMRGDDSLVRIDGGQATALGWGTDWLTAVIVQGRASMTTPGVVPDDATAFLTAIRRAAAASR